MPKIEKVLPLHEGADFYAKQNIKSEIEMFVLEEGKVSLYSSPVQEGKWDNFEWTKQELNLLDEDIQNLEGDSTEDLDLLIMKKIDEMRATKIPDDSPLYANNTPYRLYWATDTEKMYINISDTWVFCGTLQHDLMHGSGKFSHREIDEFMEEFVAPVVSVNSMQGKVRIVAGSGIEIKNNPTTGTIEIINTGGGGVSPETRDSESYLYEYQEYKCPWVEAGSTVSANSQWCFGMALHDIKENTTLKEVTFNTDCGTPLVLDVYQYGIAGEYKSVPSDITGVPITDFASMFTSDPVSAVGGVYTFKLPTVNLRARTSYAVAARKPDRSNFTGVKFSADNTQFLPSMVAEFKAFRSIDDTKVATTGSVNCTYGMGVIFETKYPLLPRPYKPDTPPPETTVTLSAETTPDNRSPLGYYITSAGTVLDHDSAFSVATYYYNVPEGATVLEVENISSDSNKLRVSSRNTTEVPVWQKGISLTKLFLSDSAPTASINLTSEHKQLFFYNGGGNGGKIILTFKNSAGKVIKELSSTP